MAIDLHSAQRSSPQPSSTGSEGGDPGRGVQDLSLNKNHRGAWYYKYLTPEPEKKAQMAFGVAFVAALCASVAATC